MISTLLAAGDSPTSISAGSGAVIFIIALFLIFGGSGGSGGNRGR